MTKMQEIIQKAIDTAIADNRSRAVSCGFLAEEIKSITIEDLVFIHFKDGRIMIGGLKLFNLRELEAMNEFAFQLTE